LGKCVELARIIYIRCVYGNFCREIAKCTVIYGVYIQLFPTLHVCACGFACVGESLWTAASVLECVCVCVCVCTCVSACGVG